MKLSSNGFTLIELMIVVAIVGILAAVAVPVYQTYVAKSQAARVMTETGGLRSLIEACINEGKTTIGTDANSCDPSAVDRHYSLEALKRELLYLLVRVFLK